ncbi:MAG: anthranilate synthase component I [Chloroflexi bacterium]|nr:anthranilate synthase component I [Chloroflexota bacterium]
MSAHVFPSLDELAAMAARYRLAPIYREVLADVETPVSALLKLGAGPGSFLLESVEGGESVARYSFVSAGLERSLRIFEGHALYAGADGETLLPYDDPLELVHSLVARKGVAKLPGLPRFGGGAVGYLGYELVRKFEPRVPAARNDVLGLPLAHLMMVDTLLVFDHLRGTIKVVTYVPLEDDLPSDYRRGCQRIDALLDRLRVSAPSLGLEDAPQRSAQVGAVRSNQTRAEFEDRVRRAKEQIAAGECIQVVLSQRLSVDTSASPVTLYRALRAINPSPYMYFLNFGGYQIVGASPELLVLVENGNVSTRPIAGTISRGQDDAEDAVLEQRLLADEKERAEHVMLVDLGRNDIGRVARPGSVAVPRLMGVERYSHVMHIVSHVTGTLRADYKPVDALRACFPAGTLSGAPKVRAMQLIAEIEQDQRGPYGGAIGFFGRDGDLEAAITIRTMVLKDGVAHVQAGGGIVADSDPTAEYEESMNKARAVLTAVAEADRMEAASRLAVPSDGSLGHAAVPVTEVLTA